MTIEELAVKNGANLMDIEFLLNKHNLPLPMPHGSNYFEEYKARYKAFADEWLALNSNEPFGYWHAGKTEEESDFFIAKDSGDVSCPDCIKLYKANPINQAFVKDLK